jgi:hypothetical protein
MTLSQRADELEERMIAGLEAAVPVKSVLYTSGERDPRSPLEYSAQNPAYAGKHFLMGHDARLPKMPDRPTLVDFFRLRFSAGQHLLQSARHARNAGCDEKTILACLLHDVGVMGFIRSDHGYWGAQLVEPYVDEEVSWAIRAHQVLRFFPDPQAGYEYPELYIKFFGADYRPEPYIYRAYERIRNHKWYMTARLITVNDIYSFEPGVQVELDDFIDVIERNFRQPEEGLGFDDSPSAHMWRTINWPTRFL